MANSKCRWNCPDQWSEWSEWLASGLHARNRWRLPVLMTGMLLAGGRRTVTSWLRAAGVTDDYLAGGSYALEVATRLVPAEIHLRPLYDPENKRVRA